MNKDRVLFIIEGEEPENKIIEEFVKKSASYHLKSSIITCVYGNNIYDLYEAFNNNSDLDFLPILKEVRKTKKGKDVYINKRKLEDFDREDFSEIYLFFDYDAHADRVADNKLLNMLKFFDNETEQGKLYISYPMVEGLKHCEVNTTFEELTYPIEEGSSYKRYVANNTKKSLIDLRKYNQDTWRELLELHIKKANKIVSNNYIYPKK